MRRPRCSLRDLQLHGTRMVTTARAERRLVPFLVALTAVSGLVDSVSYLSFGGVFTSNMTGNLAVLSFALTGHELPLRLCALSLAGFVSGAVVGGRISRRDGTVYPPSLGLMISGALLLVVMAALASQAQPASLDLLTPALSVAMGVQGVVARAVNVADLPTTVVTSTLTGLLADSALGGGSGARWCRRLSAGISFISGASLGAGLHRFGDWLALIPATILVAAAAVGLSRARRTMD